MYYGAWGVYLVTALLLVAAWYYCTRGLAPGFWRGSLRWVVICLLFVPARSGVETVLLAPAWVVAVFGVATEGRDVMMFGARPLVAALALGIAIVLVTSLVRLLRPAPVRPVRGRAGRAAPDRRRRGAARRRR